MDITEEIELHDCPICAGAGLIEEEDHGYYVACLDCGSYTGTVGYKDEDERFRKGCGDGRFCPAGGRCFGGHHGH